MSTRSLLLASLALIAPTVAQESAPLALRELKDGPLSSIHQRLLDQVKTAPLPQWMGSGEQLAGRANASVLKELITLAADARDEARVRAGTVLLMLHSRDSLGPALELAVGDRSLPVRRHVASTLVSGGSASLLDDAELTDVARRGLKDADPEVRFAIALALAAAGDPAAIPELKKALTHRDHHRRESAALALAQLGDASGARVLIKMLGYSDGAHPLLKANASMKKDAAAWNDLLKTVQTERIRVCGYLGALAFKPALSLLKKHARSKDAPLAEAARRAIESIEGAK